MLATDLKPLQRVLSQYHQINSRRVWADLLFSAVVGWSALILAGLQPVFSPLQVILELTAALALYRGQVFIHEVSHFKRKLPWLERTYNILFGFPNAYPAYIYFPHQWHHKVDTFGTQEDPEYVCMKGRSKLRLWTRPIIASLLLPYFLWVRFGILPLLYPLFNDTTLRKIYSSFSTLVMNSRYRRPTENWSAEKQTMIEQDLACAAYKVAALVAIAIFHIVPLQTLILWQSAISLASLMNMFRAQLNHDYASVPQKRSKEEQFMGSVSLRTRWYNELWAPLGLTYHSIHHLAPAIPYHNLRKAHEALLADPETAPFYEATLLPNAQAAFQALVKSCATTPDGPKGEE